MRQVAFTLYTFDELPTQAAKDKALSQFTDEDLDYDWWLSVYETWKPLLEQAGFLQPDISFSGFWAKGDGACFDCSSVDIIKALGTETEDFRLLLPMIESGDIAASVVKTCWANRYCHENTRDVIVSTPPDISPELDKLAEKLEAVLNRNRYDLCQQVYADLEKEYEYLTSSESLSQILIDNQYEFHADGTIA